MFFRTQTRTNPHTGQLSIYYRLVENNRNALGGVSQRNIMTVGFMDDVSTEDLHRIADRLDDRIAGQTALFEENDTVRRYVDNLYTRLVEEKRIDRVLDARKRMEAHDWQRVDMNSIENRDVRELGAEWMCLQTLRRLQIDRFLDDRGWSAGDRDLALAHIVCRTVYPASELKTVRYMQENSAICELLGLDAGKVTKDKLYRISHKLYANHEGLENHLSRKTNELFALQDKIIIFDLTNTYFEGEMRESELARRGRSKEKRSDCPLIVLALVVNVEGFIKYSAVYEGNKADCKTLGAMIDKLSAATVKSVEKSEKSENPVVVIDAGIATEDNLKMIIDKGFDYVCVSRKSLKNYAVPEGVSPVTVSDNKKRPIELIQVQTEGATDREYYLKVISPTKSLKEAAMNKQFFNRYEEGLALILKGITTKGGVKKYDKVNRRLGRLAQKYPSAHRLYEIRIEKDEKEVCTSMTWEKKAQAATDKENTFGVYFLRTCIKEANEKLVWTVYNCIREIESSIRTLKTDLDLRPVFHKTDDASRAHLHLGIMAYWVVNTIRHQLKGEGITSDWRELVRIMNTQKCVTTNLTNDKGQRLSVRCCSKPATKAALLYDALKMKHAPFIRKKSVVHNYEMHDVKKFDILKDSS
jgi:transposase